MQKEERRKTFNYNILSSILLYVWSLLFLFSTTKIKNPESKMFPYFICFFAIILATVLLIKSLTHKGENEEVYDFSGSASALMMAVILLIYIGVTALLGFYLATPIYLFISMHLLGQKNKKVIIIVSIALPLIIYLFFDLLLGMRIPMGIFF